MTKANKIKRYYYFLSVLFLASSILTVLISLGSYFYLSSMKHKVLEQESTVTMLSEKSAILSELKVRYEVLAKDRPLINDTLPKEKEASRLISDIDGLAQGSGLEFISVKSAATETEKEIQDKALLQTKKGKYSQEMPLIIEVRGPYSNFIRFVESVERYQRLININSLKIDKSDREGTTPDDIIATLNITVYLKK